MRNPKKENQTATFGSPGHQREKPHSRYVFTEPGRGLRWPPPSLAPGGPLLLLNYRGDRVHLSLRTHTPLKEEDAVHVCKHPKTDQQVRSGAGSMSLHAHHSQAQEAGPQDHSAVSRLPMIHVR